MPAVLPRLSERHQTQRIDGERAVTSAPVEVRAGYSAGCAYEADLLPPRDSVTLRDEHFTEMEVARENAGAVIDVDHVSGEEEFVDQRDDAAV